MAKYNILIVEDHALTRFGLKTAFESVRCEDEEDCVDKVFETENAQKGLEIIAKENIDVIIMDLGLPDMDGIEATKIIKEKYPSKKVVILSSHEKEEDVIRALNAGANTYCTKDISPEKLVSLVNSVLKGAAWFDPKVAQYVLNAAASAQNHNKDFIQETSKTCNESNLTSREKQVLTLIAQGYTNSEIAKKLEVSINTTKAHVCNILQKLSVQDRTQAAIKALKDNII